MYFRRIQEKNKLFVRKKIHFSLLLIFLFQGVFAQNNLRKEVISESDYDFKKESGLLESDVIYYIQNNSTFNYKTGYSPISSDFTEAIQPSDDGSSPKITLPFDFCFFGDTEKEIYINNNGNVSFDNPFTTSTALNFPFNNFKILAPFWADADTRKKGKVYYKLTPTALVVNWLDIGHFKYDTIRGNTFQMVITDGNDPILPQGFNVGFFYDEIQWTTGNASGGTNGFGGAPAAVGINKGNNTDFVQIGKFDTASNNYDGPFGSNDGAFWLSDRAIYMNICSSGNLPPIFSGKGLSDTMSVCVGDELNLKIDVLSPEQNQVSSITANLGFTGGTVVQHTQSNTPVYEYKIVPTASDVGNYNFTFGAFDNGNPAKSSTFPLVLQIGGGMTNSPVINGGNRVCAGQKIPLKVTPSGFTSYQWSNGVTIDSVLLGVGTHKVTVTDGVCKRVLKHRITEEAYQPKIIGNKFICPGDTFVLKVDEGFNDSTYKWSNNDTTISTSFSTPGTFFVTVTEKGGCIGVDSFEVKTLGQDPFKIIASSDTSCNGAPVTLSTGFAFDSILWSTTQTVQTIQVGQGNYIVGVGMKSNSGTFCLASDTIDVALHNFPSVSISGDTSICQGSSTLIAVDSTYDAYLWSNSITTQSSTFSSPGVKQVIVREESCYDTLSFKINEFPIPKPKISGNKYYCPGGDSVQLHSGFGAAWDSVMWSTGATAPFINVVNGSYTLTVYKDGCSATATHTVDTLGSKIKIVGDSILCPGGTILSTGDKFTSYLWSNGDTTRLTTKVGPGSYWVKVTMNGGCTADSDTITIDPNSVPTVKIIGDTLICGSNGGVIHVPLGYKSYLWNTSAETPGIIVKTAGKYSVTVKDSSGCEVKDTVDVKVSVAPKPNITGDLFYCGASGSTVLAIDTFNTIKWSTGDSTKSITVKKGTYTVVVTDSVGCKGIDGPVVVVEGNPTAQIFGDTTACPGDTLKFYAVSSDSIKWFNGATTDTIWVPELQVSLDVTDKNGCKNTVSYSVTPLTSPTADFTISPEVSSLPNALITFKDKSTIPSGTIVKWSWNYGDGASSDTTQNSTHAFAQDGKYSVVLTVTSDIGCRNSKTIPYSIISKIEATNVITPNGDFINDYLKFKGLEQFPGSKLYIFNRWGEQLYEDEDYRNNWDGYFVEDGTYFYILELGGEGTVIKGTFTLVR